MLTQTQGLLARFWAKIDKGSGECWVWTAGRDKNGYGRIAVDGRAVWAHRLAWIIEYGEDPTGLDVLHTCDNPPCVRPSHLFLGTQADNAKDMWAKGRGKVPRFVAREFRAFGAKNGMRRHPERCPRGEGHGMSKLTASDVLAIRASDAGGDSQRAIASRYGVAQFTIRSILSGLTWKHVQ